MPSRKETEDIAELAARRVTDSFAGEVIEPLRQEVSELKASTVGIEKAVHGLTEMFKKADRGNVQVLHAVTKEQGRQRSSLAKAWTRIKVHSWTFRIVWGGVVTLAAIIAWLTS